MMTLAIDASSANKEVKTGVEWYAFHLIEAMKRAGLREGERARLLSPSRLTIPLSELAAGWESRVLAWPPKRFWMQARVSVEMALGGNETLFVPAQALPRILPKKTAVTLHDVAFHRRPELFEESLRRRLEWTTRNASMRANLVFTVSEASKRDLIEAYGMEADRIRVTPLAADAKRFRPLPVESVEPVRARYGLHRPFFLFVGRLERKKNLAGLIRAFEALCDSGDRETELVLVGGAGYGYAEIQDEIALLSDPTRVRELGYVPEGDLPALMNAATALCFPSFEEGFGIPVLEAMACGTPAIASDIPALRETGGDAAFYAKPEDAAGWAGLMKLAVSDADWREARRAAGLERAAKFSWDATAAATWDGLRSLR
jgi:glycosyltransferase involved in cell wall biosynthesis